MSLTIGAALISLFKEPLQKGSANLKDEFLHIFDSGLSEYIDSFYDKYSQTKTFIYRDEKVAFYEIFFPVSIKSKTGTFNTATDLKTLFQRKKFVTIIGTAGSGKSMLMKHIFLSTVNQSFRIPLVIELRNLNDYQGKMYDYVSSILTKSEIAITSKIVDRILKQGKFIFLFDGYDEIFSSSKDRITIDLEEFVDTYNNNLFVVTSRPGSNAESLQRFDNYYVQALNNKQIEEFIKLQFKNTEDLEYIDRILSVINKPENKDYHDYLSNPLLLSMFIFTFKAYPELPKYKNKFYSNVFDILCTKHDSFTKKGFWLHERKSGLQNDELENVLKWFSYITIFRGKYNFDELYLKDCFREIIKKLNVTCDVDNLIYDLTVSIAIMIQDGTEFTFPHKSLQEYFTAILIKGLDEREKSKIYTTKFEMQRQLSNGGNFNFYKLCFELDKSFFCKYFLIPNTTRFIKDIYSKSPLKLTLNLLAAFEIKFYESTETKNDIGSYSQRSVDVDAFLDFFSLNDISPPFDVLNASSHLLPETFQNAIEDTSHHRENVMLLNFESPTQNSKKEIVMFLEQTGITKRSIKLINDVKKGLENLILSLSQEDENIKDLLET